MDRFKKGFETNFKGLFGDDPQLMDYKVWPVATASITKPDRMMEELTTTVKDLDDTLKFENFDALDANTKALRELKDAILLEIKGGNVLGGDVQETKTFDKVINTQAGAGTQTNIRPLTGPMFEQNPRALQNNQSNNQFDRLNQRRGSGTLPRGRQTNLPRTQTSPLPSRTPVQPSFLSRAGSTLRGFGGAIRGLGSRALGGPAAIPLMLGELINAGINHHMEGRGGISQRAQTDPNLANSLSLSSQLGAMFGPQPKQPKHRGIIPPSSIPAGMQAHHMGQKTQAGGKIESPPDDPSTGLPLPLKSPSTKPLRVTVVSPTGKPMVLPFNNNASRTPGQDTAPSGVTSTLVLELK